MDNHFSIIQSKSSDKWILRFKNIYSYIYCVTEQQNSKNTDDAENFFLTLKFQDFIHQLK
jgi:hypothetical protein